MHAERDERGAQGRAEAPAAKLLAREVARKRRKRFG
jgi:hypothetical protein